MNIPWWGYVILAGLSWGTYVPIIFFGGSELSARPGIGGRLMAIVCVGVAYVLLAIVIPVVIFLMNQKAWGDVKSDNTSGYIFAGLAGVMGAVGAICVVFASSEALGLGRQQFTEQKAALEQQANEATDPAVKEAVTAQLTDHVDNEERHKAKYRILIAPLIFSIAPIVNTLLSSFWHTKPGVWNYKFQWEDPGLLFWVGIVLVAAGTGLVLYAKEKSEVDRTQERLRVQKEERLKAEQEKKAAESTPPATNP